MRDQLLVLSPVSDVEEVRELERSFASTAIGYAELALVMGREDRSEYPTKPRWIFVDEGSYGERMKQALGYAEPYRIYLFALPSMRWSVPAWDYRLKEIFDDHGDIVVVDLGDAVAIGSKLLQLTDVPRFDWEEFSDRVINFGESYRAVYAYPWKVEEERNGVLAE